MIPWMARFYLLLTFSLASAMGGAIGTRAPELEVEEQVVNAPAACLISVADRRVPRGRRPLPANSYLVHGTARARFDNLSSSNPAVSPQSHSGHRLSNGLIAPLLI
jgi:hypothetical protein